MRVAGIRIIRNAGLEGASGSSHALKKIVKVSRSVSRLILYHELGHCFDPQVERLTAYCGEMAWARMIGYLGGPTGLKIIQEEAAAWRFAVRLWHRKHGQLRTSEIQVIRNAFATYLTRRWAQEKWRRQWQMEAICSKS